jgi:succinate dehydrogenase/fumarate reductase flavoprotein subunit
MEIFTYDILVIGAGAAGLRSAIEAKGKDFEVAILSKTSLGKGSCTSFSGAGFSAALGNVTRDEHFENTMRIGRETNNKKLVKILVNEAPNRIFELKKFGVNIDIGDGIGTCRRNPPGLGLEITLPLLSYAEKMGVKPYDHRMVIDLMKEDQVVCGAIAYNSLSGEIEIFQSKATVLATGGGGGLYGNSDNPIHITGDGYILAVNAGAVLQDMEFVQFYPMGLVATLIVPPSLADDGKILNKFGEEIPQKYGISDKPIAVRCRDQLSRAIFSEIRKGLGVDNHVLLDLTELDDEAWNVNNLTLSWKAMLVKNFRSYDKPVRIRPVCHHFMGGISINEKCETGVPGLYAAGEVTGGIHGANRMGGNALSDTLVFGVIAGQNAAMFAVNSSFEKINKEKINGYIKYTHFIDNSTDKGVSIKKLRKILGEILTENAGIIRNNSGLKKGILALKNIKTKDIPMLTASTPREVVKILELLNGIEIGEMIMLSALHRKESRGSHFREDFPSQNDNWRINTIITKIKETLVASTKPL